MGSGACCQNYARACLNNEAHSDINSNKSFTYNANNETKRNHNNKISYPNDLNTNIFYQKNIYANSCSNINLSKTHDQPLCTSVKQIYPPIKDKSYDSQPNIHNSPSYYIQKSNVEKFLEPYSFKDPIDSVIESKIKNNNNQINKNKIDNIYLKFSQFGEPMDDNDFKLDGWKEFYPKNDNFFNWNKGSVIKNQYLINNPESENIKEIEIYYGEINNYNQKHGFGILTNYQCVKKGIWRNDNFTGWGRESRRNGVSLEGKFIDGFVNGKGILKNNLGNEYKGDFINNIREGKGILTTQKFIYEGDFKNNVLCGNGKIKFIQDGHFYEGEFKNNNIDGKGIFKWKNGDEYEGLMQNGKMDGYGTYRYADGDFYEGYYKDGVKNGKGKFVSYNENEIYEGEFKNGKPHGKGVLLKNGFNKHVEFYDGKLIKVNE